MLPNIKNKILKNKELVKKILIVTIIVIIFLVLYKIFFYSTDEKSVYGIRLRDMKGHEITKKDITDYKEQASKIEGINKVSVVKKGKLLKYFITLESDISKDDAKVKIEEILGSLTENVKGFYDVTFYVKQEVGDEEKYILIGYKHKTNETITYGEI